MSLDKRKSYSAGILPYTIRDGVIYYLLGRDWRDEGWSDFGGKVEEKDVTISDTAMREFYEETMGSVLSRDQLEHKFIGQQNKKQIKSVTLNGSPYYMYFVEVEDDNYGKYFEKTYNFMRWVRFNDSKYLEKCEISWFESNELNDTPLKLRNIFKRTLTRCNSYIKEIEKEILKENALKR